VRQGSPSLLPMQSHCTAGNTRHGGEGAKEGLWTCHYSWLQVVTSDFWEEMEVVSGSEHSVVQRSCSPQGVF